MFSLDVDNALVTGGKETWKSCTCTSEIRAAPSRPASAIPFTPEGSRLENFYFFFDAHKQLDEVFAKAACSAHVDMARIGIDHIVRPEFRDCRTICIANKQGNDCIYFAGIKIDQFISFLK